MGHGVGGVSCAYLVTFIVIFCLPYTWPANVQSMNYSSAIAGGVTMLVTVLWFWKRNRSYKGFQVETTDAVSNT
jgi:hypothetical protein